jgi:hypothetical protein
MKRPRFSWRYALLITGVVVLSYLVMDFNSRMTELRQLTLQKEVVSGKLAGLEGTQASLQTQIAYATSDAAVMRWAYEDAHMVRSGDNPVVPLAPPASTPMPTPTPVVTQAAVSNWQVWMWLLVDSGSPGGKGLP